MIAAAQPGQVDAAPDWCAADRAYQLHHFGCAQCCAAGSAPDTRQRCPEGQALLSTYTAAGVPPHFCWLQPKGGM